MRVAVVGSAGQLGSDVVRVLSQADGFEVVPLPHSAVEVTDAASVRAAVMGARPDAVVNCAAYVRVDDAEEEAEEAFRVNALGALYVARACAEAGALCVYVSTDYVFDGAKEEPYTEDDVPAPVNVYGASKLAGEHLTRIGGGRWLVVRVASLFGRAGARGKGGNFVETILARARAGESLYVVDDVRMSPTYTLDAAHAFLHLLRESACGVVHVTNRGSASWYEFAQKALEPAGLEARIRPVSSEEYSRRAARPRNSVLATCRTGSFLQALRPWEQALVAYMEEKTDCVPG